MSKGRLNSGNSNGPIAWMAKNLVAANLLMIVLMVGGVVSTFEITKEFMPDTTEETVSVNISYPGASPEEIEQGVMLAIEDAVQGLPNAGEIWSLNFPGRAIFRVKVLPGGDVQQLLQEVQGAVDSVRSFPEDMEKPRVLIDPRRRDVMSLVLYGDTNRLVLKDAAETVIDMLRQTGRVALMELQGIPDLQVNIDISEDELRHIGLTRAEIASIVRDASVDLAAGGIKAPTGEELVRVQDRRDYADGFARIPIVVSEDGGVVYLEDIAKVEDGFEDTDKYATFNGQMAVMIEIFRTGDDSPTEVAEAVENAIPEIMDVLGAGLTLEVLDSRAEMYSERVGLLLNNGGLGLVLVLVSLGMLLNARLAFWVMMGIPISFLGAMLIMPGIGVTINMISLFAFILALGIVVDDAIVVGENVYAHREMGKPWQQAAIDGAREVTKPIIFSILTNMVAFAPLLFMPGTRGKLFWMIPAVVICAFAISLIECLFILPAHLAHGKGDRAPQGLRAKIENVRKAVSDKLHHFINEIYAPLLDRVLTRARIVPFVGIGILALALGYGMSGRLGYQSFPRVESDYSYAYLTYPYGTPVRQTEAIAERMIQAAREIAERPENEGLVRGIFAEIGDDGSHTAELRVFLGGPDIREKTMSTTAFSNAWRELVGEVPGVESLRFQGDRGGPGGGHALSLELSHRDRDMLAGAADMLTEKMIEYPLVVEAINDFQAGQPQYDVRLNDVGRSLGLSAEQVARQLRGKFYGVTARRQLRSRDEITILVRGTEQERHNKSAFETALIKTPSDTFVPLHEIASVSRASAYTKIERRHGSRVVDVDVDIQPRSKTPQIIASVDEEIWPEIEAAYPGISKRFSGRQQADRDSMAGLIRSFPLAMFIVFALLAIPFSSYTLGLLIMGMTIPFGLVGSMLGHIIMGYSLTIPSLLGFIALTGVLVNDSLILVEFAERERRAGVPGWKAMRNAAIQRFRPILLTTVTTFAGLAPMMLETSRQARFLIPMAISLGFGLLFATGVILLMLPAIYVLLERAGLLPDVEELPDAEPETPAS